MKLYMKWPRAERRLCENPTSAERGLFSCGFWTLQQQMGRPALVDTVDYMNYIFYNQLCVQLYNMWYQTTDTKIITKASNVGFKF